MSSPEFSKRTNFILTACSIGSLVGGFYFWESAENIAEKKMAFKTAIGFAFAFQVYPQVLCGFKGLFGSKKSHKQQVDKYIRERSNQSDKR